MAKIWLIHEGYYEESLPMTLKNTRPLHIQFHNFVVLMSSAECQVANPTDCVETCHQDARLQQTIAVTLCSPAWVRRLKAKNHVEFLW